MAVSVWDLQAEGLEETAALIRKQGERAIACVGNAAMAADIAKAIARTRAELGPITILVNNAALSPFAPFETMTEEMWDSLMAVNLKGPFLCTKAIIPDMLAAGWGRIINISSSSAQSGSTNQTHYAASKAGVISFTKALAIEYATKGITANNVPPGFVNTEGLRAAPLDIEAFAKKDADAASRQAGGYRRSGRVPRLGRGGLHHRPYPERQWRTVFELMRIRC